MNAKDIALLCAAAGAVTAGAVTVYSGAKGKKASAVKASPVRKMKRQPTEFEKAGDKSEPYPLAYISYPDGVKITSLKSIFLCGDDAYTLFFDSKKHFCYEYTVKSGCREIRCPTGAFSAAHLNGCTLYLTPKGGIFVYDDAEKEPILRDFCNALKAFAVGDSFVICSDSLLYEVTSDGDIIRTVSLSSMFNLVEGDVCDAENSDDSFAQASVHVSNYVALGGSVYAAVTAEGRSYILYSDDGFSICEAAYENVCDVCVFDKCAYFVTRDNMLIKMHTSADCCETAGKYSLGQSENTSSCANTCIPVSISACPCGLIILYSDGSTRAILPEIADENRKSELNGRLKKVNSTLSSLYGRIKGIYSSENSDRIYVSDCKYGTAMFEI